MSTQEKKNETQDNKDRGFGRGQRGRGKQQRGRRNNRGGKRGRRDAGKWRPLTKLGRLVNTNKITSLEEIFKFSLPIKEVEIVDKLIKEDYKEEVMKVKPVQK